jgi:hypothetical protein
MGTIMHLQSRKLSTMKDDIGVEEDVYTEIPSHLQRCTILLSVWHPILECTCIISMHQLKEYSYSALQIGLE